MGQDATPWGWLEDATAYQPADPTRARLGGKAEHFCKGCPEARYVGGTTVFACERKGAECPRRQ